MIAAITLFLIVSLSVLITTIALIHKGFSAESAKFQSRSAYTGTGFSTGESEKKNESSNKKKNSISFNVSR